MSNVEELYSFMKSIEEIEQIDYLPRVETGYSWDIYYTGITSDKSTHWETFEVCVFIAKADAREALETICAQVGKIVYQKLWEQEPDLEVEKMLVHRDFIIPSVTPEQAKKDKDERLVLEKAFTVLRFQVKFPCLFSQE